MKNLLDIRTKGYSMGASRPHSMSKEELRYAIFSRWVKEKIVTIEIDGKETFQVATPLDFWPDAPTDVVSPEELFVAAAISCYGVSLSGVSKKFHAVFTDFNITGVGILQKRELGWEFAQITINAKIFVPTASDKKKMAKVAERAHTYCLVANSMKCPVRLNYEIIIGPSSVPKSEGAEFRQYSSSHTDNQA